MLFGEWLHYNNKGYSDKFVNELNEAQQEDKTGLDLTIMMSGIMQLMEDWMNYKSWSDENEENNVTNNGNDTVGL